MSRSGIYDLKYGFIPDDDCPQEPPKPTNADRIRSMSDEELAKKMSWLESFAISCGGEWSPEKWLEWLRKEAEDGSCNT